MLLDEFGVDIPAIPGLPGDPAAGDRRGGFFADFVLEDGRTVGQAISDFEAQLRNDLLNSILVQSLIALAFVAVIAVVAGWFMSRRALAPVAEITRTARGFSESNLSERVDLEGPDDEIKELADTMDDMLDRVERGYVNQRNFAAYASHELRTPLSVMRVEADNLLDSETGSPQERSLARIIQGEVQRSETLISQLLAITRSRSGNLESQRIDLADIVGEMVSDVVALADREGIELDLSLVDAVIEGDPALLRSMVTNLLTNGIVHNRQGGKVEVGVTTDDHHSVLVIENTGPQLTTEDVRRMYRPFERIEQDRASGLGLGLAVVTSIADVHNATMTPTARVDGGLRTVVRFPVSDVPIPDSSEPGPSGPGIGTSDRSLTSG